MEVNMSELDTRLAEAVEKRNQLEADVQRIAGRREAALNALQDVEKEIKERGLDPDTLADTVADLQKKYETAVSELEQGITAAHTDLTPYLENNP
jgi:predicted nuclease with TOPRIM domain